MKKFVVLICCAVCGMVGCKEYASKDVLIQIYDEGGRQVTAAQSEAQIDSIIYETTSRVAAIGNGPEGEKILTASDNEAIMQAQMRFVKAVQDRSKVLSGGQDSTLLIRGVTQH